MRSGIRNWRDMILHPLETIDQQYSMVPVASHDTLANMFTAVIEGGILRARNLGQNQGLTYRAFGRIIDGANLPASALLSGAARWLRCI